MNRPVLRRRFRGLFQLVLACICLLSLLFLLSYARISPPLEAAQSYPSGIILRARTGEILRVGLNANDQDCRPYYSVDSTDWVVKALVAAEDKRFWQHPGMDILSILRALRQNITTGRRISGASTITAQTVRLITPHPRTWRWKYIEAFQALQLERHLTKEQILEQYLNRTPMGSNLIGIEAGALGWFGKPTTALSLGEAALLIGMVQSPSRFRPDRNLVAALKRRSYVLDRMQACGMITPEARITAEETPLTLHRAPRPFDHPYFADWAQAQCPTSQGDYTTTLDLHLQETLNTLVQSHATEHACHAAAVLIEVSSGAVRALACSGDYFNPSAGQVNTALAPRPAGSTLKPFILATALDQGLIMPDEWVADAPRQFADGYTPANFNSTYWGRLPISQALILSLNIPFIDLTTRIGLPHLTTRLHALGLQTLHPQSTYHGTGLAVGNAEVRLLALANAYATLARGGQYLPATAFESAQKDPQPTIIPVFSEGASWLLYQMLSGPQRAQNSLGHLADTQTPQAAWKTGTSAAHRDAWTVIWNPTWVIGVWCGHLSGHFGETSLTGLTTAAPLAWAFFRTLQPAQSTDISPPQPPSVITQPVCTLTGRLATHHCPHSTLGFTLQNTTTRFCTHCPSSQTSYGVPQKPTFPPTETRPQDTPTKTNLQSPSPQTSPSRPMILSPKPNAHYIQLKNFPNQGILLHAIGPNNTEKLWWFLNGRPLGTTLPPHQRALPFPPPGHYRITCSTQRGLSTTTAFSVE